ncbi:MAG: hypothetical protein ACOH1N_00750 [Lutibacter sp.]
MKKLLLISFLLSQITLFSQEKLKGNYCTISIGESDVTCIDFKENNRFVYRTSGCLGTYRYGIGKYNIKNSSLTLLFDKSDKEFRSEIKTSKLENVNNDSIVHSFKIIDENGIKIPSVTIFKKTGDFEFDENISDENGNILFRYLNNRVNEDYEVEYFGYENFKFKIDNRKSYEILIKLSLSKPTWINGEQHIYEFNIVNSETIEIQGQKCKLRK